MKVCTGKKLKKIKVSIEQEEELMQFFKTTRFAVHASLAGERATLLAFAIRAKARMMIRENCY